MVHLLFYWLGFNQTSKSVAIYNVSKATESKPAKKDVAWAVIILILIKDVSILGPIHAYSC